MIKQSNIEQLSNALLKCDSVIIGAGAGLSTAAGFTYAGERFEHYFNDFARKYGIRDMYSGGFFPYPTPEERWGFWCRMIWVNRYMPIPHRTYDQLLQLVRDTDHFVITTNVDHCFQKSGFCKERLYYTQGDYGLFQCSRPCCQKTWDNYDQVRAMVEAQGFAIADDGTLLLPEGAQPAMAVPTELIPTCPECGAPATTNLRADATFVEDEGWYQARDRYQAYLSAHAVPGQRVLFLDLGIGYNTPGIIKYPFWQMTAHNPAATYACVNLGEAVAPKEIASRSICVDGDIDEALQRLLITRSEKR